MSTDIYVLSDQPVPFGESWQVALDEHRFPVKFRSPFDPKRDGGAFPMEIENVEVAPEIYLEEGGDYLKKLGITSGHRPWRFQAHFASGASLPEFAAAVYSAAALAVMTEGVVCLPGGDLYSKENLADLLAQAECAHLTWKRAQVRWT